ncbi:TonB-dependent receptor [Chryseobacterium sp. HSC-36S06]|uniref:TonB-dependent receptor domain-containing protein n=1 Tax=Chryseobacterium sp. HSC-36S06 TaxID=2910970 RepID=UPI0020A213EF|nr:TonB-dependent receptor [Chryseobacterium sp. HSC-36S06]MCP2038002.1 outer membrane cobalamin receptor [Chryseobacterium sp. HSC-36S06]
MIKTEITQNFTRKTLGLTFLLTAAAFAFAQEKMNVSGQIVDKQNQPVPYASVSFSNKANKLFSDAALTDEKGNYQLALTPGNYDITVEAIDFKKSTLNKQIARPGNLGSISVEPEGSLTNTKTQDIQGVVITAAAVKPYRVELDKKVYDPSTDIISKGGNLQDVLTNVPSVSVETDGTVSMRGNSNVRFLINGKPSALLGIDSGANALQSIPADQIERIEVITNPSSKFEASGTAGILNIILKKTKGMGFNGSVTGSVGYLPSTNLNTNLSWKKGSWTWFLNGGGGYRESEGKNDSDTRFFDPATGATTSYFEQNSLNASENKNYNANAGFTVDLSDKTSFNVSGMLRTFESENNNTVDNFGYDAGRNVDSYTQTLALGNSKNLSLQGDLGLDHKFNDQGHNIYLSLSLQKSDNESVENSREFDESVFKYGSSGNNNTINKSIIGKIDYELPIGEASKFEAGYRFDNNNNDYDFLNRETDTFLNYGTVDAYSGNTVYSESINAVYTQFKSKIDKFGYQLGLRAENSNIGIDYRSLSGNQSSKEKNYTGFFPSVFLSYDLGSSNNQLLVNYSRRINRPRSWFLIPYPTSLANRQNLFRGNEDLNPEYIDSFEVGYAIQKKKITINPTLYYRATQDETRFVVVSETPGSNVLITKPFNIGNEHQYGLDLNATADLFSWWKIMASADLFGYKSDGEYFDAATMIKPMSFDGSGFSTRFRLTNSFKVDKTFSMQVQGFYRGGQKTASSESKPMYVLNFGANKTIWKGNGTLAFNIQDILGTRGREMTGFGNNFEKESFMRWNPRTFNVSLTYRFKQGEKIDQPKRKKDINSNSSGDDEPQGPM